MYDIIVFAHLFRPHLGGLEKYIETFYTNIPDKRILIITSKYKKTLDTEEQFKNLHILRTDSIQIINDKYYIPSLRGFKQIRKIFNNNYKNSPEIHTHTRFYFTNFIASLFAKNKKLTHFHFEHGSSFVRDGSPLVRLFAMIFDYTLARYTLKSSTLVFTISNSVKNFLTKHYKNLLLGPTLYNSLSFKNGKFKHKSKPKIPRLLFVGRLVKSKGICELLEACKLLKENDFPFTLTVIGDGSERSFVEKYIQKNNLKANIFIKGALPFEETQKEYLKHDIFINPSYTEGLPTTVLEALFNSLLIVATNAGGTNEIINKERLISLEELSPQVIRDSITKILIQWDKEMLIHRHLFEKAKKKFSTESVIQKYLEVSNRI